MLLDVVQVRDNPQPTAIFFTCVDSRMLPTRFTQTNVGDMFIGKHQLISKKKYRARNCQPQIFKFCSSQRGQHGAALEQGGRGLDGDGAGHAGAGVRRQRDQARDRVRPQRLQGHEPAVHGAQGHRVVVQGAARPVAHQGVDEQVNSFFQKVNFA